MITCHVRYGIDPSELEAFERFARRWMELVDQHGGPSRLLLAERRIRDESGCVRRYERTFLRPLRPRPQ